MGHTKLPPYMITLVASAARTATGNSGTLVFPIGIEAGAFYLWCTAASGTSPTLSLAIQVTADDATTWMTQWLFTQNTTTTKRRVTTSFKRLDTAGESTAIADTGTGYFTSAPITPKIRVLWTIGGTSPSFTFSVFFIETKLIYP